MNDATTTRTWATRPTSTRRIDLVGQVAPRQRLRDALHLAQGGRADRVLVTGAAGSGRSAVLDELAATSDGVTVLRAAAVDVESSLAYSALFDLCRPVLHLVDELPPMHRELLRSALSVDRSTAAAPLAVGVSLLSLLAHVSRAHPVLVIVDDIDRADAESFEAVAFAARRLAADAVAVVVAGAVGVAARLRGAGFDVVALEPLPHADAAALVERVSPTAPAPSVREAILGVAQGNPLALTLLPRSLSLSQLRGRWPLPDPLPSTDHLVDIVARELAHLSTDAQRALVVAAASLTGSCTAINAALVALGISTGAVAELVNHELLVTDGGQLRFRRPLLRTVAYARATAARRQFDTPAPAPTTGALATATTVTVQVLSGFSVTADEHDLTPPPGLAAGIVKLLALTAGRGVNVEEIIDQLWPDLTPARGRARLRNVLSRLRETSGLDGADRCQRFARFVVPFGRWDGLRGPFWSPKGTTKPA